MERALCCRGAVWRGCCAAGEWCGEDAVLQGNSVERRLYCRVAVWRGLCAAGEWCGEDTVLQGSGVASMATGALSVARNEDPWCVVRLQFNLLFFLGGVSVTLYLAILLILSLGPGTLAGLGSYILPKVDCTLSLLFF